MHPLLLLSVGALAAGVAIAAAKKNAAERLLIEYWGRVGAGEDPIAILREWAVEADLALSAAEAARAIPDWFIDLRAEGLKDAGRLIRGMDPNRTTADGRVTPHWGIDITGDVGDPLYAAKSGVVVDIEPKCGYGNIVAVASLDTDNESVMYAHLQYADVGIGELVEAGQQIGRVGNTLYCPDGSLPSGWTPERAASMGAHLHFEVHPRRVPALGARVQRRNPLTWLSQNGIPISRGA